MKYLHAYLATSPAPRPRRLDPAWSGTRSTSQTSDLFRLAGAEPTLGLKRSADHVHGEAIAGSRKGGGTVRSSGGQLASPRSQRSENVASMAWFGLRRSCVSYWRSVDRRSCRHGHDEERRYPANVPMGIVNVPSVFTITVGRSTTKHAGGAISPQTPEAARSIGSPEHPGPVRPANVDSRQNRG
jgi:hypothetical protein